MVGAQVPQKTGTKALNMLVTFLSEMIEADELKVKSCCAGAASYHRGNRGTGAQTLQSQFVRRWEPILSDFERSRVVRQRAGLSD